MATNVDLGGLDLIVNNIRTGASAPSQAGTYQATDADRYVAAGSTLTLTVASHNKKVIKLDTAAGSTVTLPASTGSGALFRFIVTVIATSNNHIIKVANANDVMAGVIVSMDDTSANAVAFAAGSTADTITLNRTTTGSVTKGEWIEIEDIAVNLWHVK